MPSSTSQLEMSWLIYHNYRKSCCISCCIMLQKMIFSGQKVYFHSQNWLHQNRVQPLIKAGIGHLSGFSLPYIARVQVPVPPLLRQQSSLEDCCFYMAFAFAKSPSKDAALSKKMKYIKRVTMRKNRRSGEEIRNAFDWHYLTNGVQWSMYMIARTGRAEE